MGVWDDEEFQLRFTRLRLDLEDHKDLYETFVEKVRRREALGSDVSMLKVHQTEFVSAHHRDDAGYQRRIWRGHGTVGG